MPSVTEICAPLTSSKYSSIPALSASAAHRGSIVHEYCELYDYGALPDEIEPDAVPYLQAWAQFCRDYGPTWRYIEHRMTNGLFAGTADRIGIIDGKPLIVDIKTTSSLDRLSKISLACQLWGYACMSQNCFPGKRYSDLLSFHNSFGVQLTKDGKYRIYKVPEITKKYSVDVPSLFYSLLNIALITSRR